MVQQLKETHSDQEQNETLNHLNKASASKPLSWPRLFSLFPFHVQLPREITS
jgi:hypothetical protein